MLSCLGLVVYVVVVSRGPHQVRRSRFLLRLCEAGPVLQPVGGEHDYLSSRRSIDPKDRLRAEEMHPREILGSYDTSLTFEGMDGYGSL